MAQRLSRRKLAEHFVRSLESGATADALTTQLAGYLVDVRRTREASLIIRDIEALLADQGTILGTVTTAFDLDTATKKAIEQRIAHETGATKVSLAERVDTDVIGGYKVSIPGKTLDQTVATQLTTLKTHFKKV